MQEMAVPLSICHRPATYFRAAYIGLRSIEYGVGSIERCFSETNTVDPGDELKGTSGKVNSSLAGSEPGLSS